MSSKSPKKDLRYSKRSNVDVGSVQEQYSEDTTLGWFYRPHTLSILAAVVSALIYVAFDEDNIARTRMQNSVLGVWASIGVLLVTSVVAIPNNGPFSRPHPSVWRFVFGVSLVYLLGAVFVLFQTVDDAREYMKFLDPSLNVPLPEETYAEDCSISVETIKKVVFDRFFLAHFIGWIVKAMMLRNATMCWIISLLWEFLEWTFTSYLPNFEECIWDSLVVDFLICNGGGIIVGLILCRKLEMREYRWHGILDIPSASGKLQRTLLQFTPESWTIVNWESRKSIRRYLSVIIVIICVCLCDLNAFFLKSVLWVPSQNNLNLYRMLLWVSWGAPTLRQIYIFVTDPRVKKLGAQSWIAMAILTVELLIVIKFSKGMFTNPIPTHILKAWGISGVIFIVCSVFALSRGSHLDSDTDEGKKEK
eukprot:TRINITY_DN4179_c1_g1_i1.p1 TRINITY_DN4179_c1_g1~~TRINITY_DN4179_c1_g1_i1.p1  ORF type:complete len:488 (+),score=115.75 TRINITY_DN4179_c1_g1_i1:210-1466(+)